MTLKTELFVFISNHPQFSANLFEELERIERYVQILHLDVGKRMDEGEGWYLVYSGKGKVNGRDFSRGDLFHCGKTERLTLTEPGILIYFSRTMVDRFMKKEPELAVPLSESLKNIRYPSETSSDH